MTETEDDAGADEGGRAALDAWQRPLHEPGGGDAFIYLVLFGPDLDRLEVSTERHRVEEVPETLELLVQGSSAVEAFLEPPMGDLLREDQPDLVERALATEHCLVLAGAVPDPPDLHYLRTVIGIATAALDVGAVAVYNLQSFGFFSPNAWHERVFAPDVPDPKDWVVLLSSDDDERAEVGQLWLHTRGLRVFGRPDLSLTGVAPDDLDTASRLLSVLIEQQVRGLVIPDDSVMDLGETLGQLAFRLAGHPDDPDFNNTHLDIQWTR
jgi:hypothetical protein